MRGKLDSLSRNHVLTRITPADAGKTKATLNERFVNQDHPRGCGENMMVGKTREALQGSPPRMRGKLEITWTIISAPGITPADAGKTL